MDRNPRPVTYERLERAEEYAIDRMSRCRDKELWGRLVDAIQDQRRDLVLGDDDDGEDTGWLCSCGNYQDDGFHCDGCGSDPPWGCSCPDCEEGWDDDEDDCEDGEYP